MRPLLIMLLTASGLVPVAASAQGAGNSDVIVMRRILSAPDPNAPNAQWTPGDWVMTDPSRTCADDAPTRRSYVCTKDGTEVAAIRCAASKPADETGTRARYDGCVTSWTTVSYGTWSTTCGNGATRTNQVSCMRNGGTAVPAPQPDASCTGVKPPVTETADVTSGCTYRWEHLNEGAWSQACSPATTRSVTWKCMRSDGTRITANPAASCGTMPSTTETGANQQGCDAVIQNGSFQGDYLSPWNNQSGALEGVPGRTDARAARLQKTQNWYSDIYQDIPYSKIGHGVFYKVTFWTRAMPGEGGATVTVSLGSDEASVAVAAESGWTERTVTIKSNGGNVRLSLRAALGQTVVLDDISIAP